MGFSCSMRGMYKPLTHAKTDRGLGFLGHMPASGMRRTSGTCWSVLSTATMMAKCTTTGLTAFEPPVSVLVSNYSLQFHFSESSHRPFLLPLHCVPLISTPLPTEMRPLKTVLRSSPRVSLCPLLFQLFLLCCTWVGSGIGSSDLLFVSHPRHCSVHQHKSCESFAVTLHYSTILLSLFKSCLTNQDKDKRV